MDTNEKICPRCGMTLAYDETSDSYYCVNCNEYFSKEDFEEKKEENAFTGKYIEIKCRVCGKQFIVKKDFDYDVCPFCYNNIIDKSDGVYGFKPNFIIPFKEDLATFKSKFFDRAKSANVPLEILTNISGDSVKGLYIPVYVYTVENTANGFLATKEKDGNYGEDFYRQKFYYIENLDVLIDSTGMISHREMADFADYDIKKVDMFFPERLKDNYTLIPTIGSENAWAELKKVCKNFVIEEVAKNAGKKQIVKETKGFNSVKDISRRMILLPVWMMEITNMGEEPHHLYVNDQTGRMVSDIPFEQPHKKSLLGKNEETQFQVRLLARELIQRKKFKTSIEYLNELRKFEVNKNDRISEIRKTR